MTRKELFTACETLKPINDLEWLQKRIAAHMEDQTARELNTQVHWDGARLALGTPDIVWALVFGERPRAWALVRSTPAVSRRCAPVPPTCPPPHR